MFPNLSRDLQRYCDWQGYGTNPRLIFKLMVICCSPSYWAIIVHRYGHWVNSFFGEGYKNPLKFILKLIYFIARQLSVYFAKVEILVTTDIGPGLFLSNQGNIILGAKRIGENFTIQYNVTVGQGVEGVPPEFGNDIWIGHDTVVYGAISVGDNTVIESGTVLSKSLPGNMVVGGNPCRILQKK